MNDSNDIQEVANQFAEALQLAEDARRKEREKEEEARKLAAGEILRMLNEGDPTLSQLTDLARFIAGGYVIVTDDTLTATNNDLKAKIAGLGRENDDLRKQVADLNGAFSIGFPDESERTKAEAILAVCKNGGGRFIDPKRVEDALKPKQAQPKQKGPSGPPVQKPPATDPDNKTQKKSFMDKILGK